MVLGVHDDRPGRVARVTASAISATMCGGLSSIERVRGVQAQAVEVVLAHPVQRVVDDEAADEIRAGPVEIDGAAPRRRVPRR